MQINGPHRSRGVTCAFAGDYAHVRVRKPAPGQGRSPVRLLRVLPIVALSFLGACALERDLVEVRHPPPQAVAVVPGAAQVSVRLVATDAREANRERVGVKKNGYGMELAPIIATNDVVAEVGAAVSAVLTAQGFSTAGGPGEVRVELLRFFNDFKIGFWAGAAEADVSINLRVTDAIGAIIYTRVITVRGIKSPIGLASGSNARDALQDGMARLMAAVAADEDFRRALLRLGAASEPARRGRPTS
jgi:uncharacterized lipoprotein YajG